MQQVLIIAEAGVNHNGSIELAKQLIDVASEAGSDYVKFQTFKAEKLVSHTAEKADYQKQNLKDSSDTQLDMLKKLELSEDAHRELIAYCNQKGIKFLSTGFDMESVDFLDSLHLDLIKIPSGEVTNMPYLEKAGASGKHIILSTGMCDLEEIGQALDVLTKAGTLITNITVLHCNTEYPTPFSDVNLKAMLQIREKFNVQVGYSDHTNGIEVPIAAVALGATVIEKHFTLDKGMEGPDHKASLDPQELKAMVGAIRHIEIAIGNGIKEPSPSEIKNKTIVRKSIHIGHACKAGHIIKEKDLVMKRPGNGISPMEYHKVTGKKLLVDVQADHLLKWDELA
jgi:N,N'-diacetyllegionaminate synthase